MVFKFERVLAQLISTFHYLDSLEVQPSLLEGQRDLGDLRDLNYSSGNVQNNDECPGGWLD